MKYIKFTINSNTNDIVSPKPYQPKPERNIWIIFQLFVANITNESKLFSQNSVQDNLRTKLITTYVFCWKMEQFFPLHTMTTFLHRITNLWTQDMARCANISGNIFTTAQWVYERECKVDIPWKVLVGRGDLWRSVHCPRGSLIAWF